MRLFGLRPLIALCAIVAAFAFVATDADARSSGRGGSAGSRGTHTYSAPPTTATAPNAARPMERSMTQPSSTASRTATAPQTTGAGGFFNRPGFMGGLFAGLLGAGLFGMLMGHGFGGGLGGFASMLGLILQIGIIALVAYLIWTWWQRRQQPATAAGPMLRDTGSGNNNSAMGFGSALGFGGGSAAPAQPAAAGSDDVGLTGDDFNTFEHLLAEVQTAYGKEDLHALRGLATPEMVSYYAEDLAENTSRGVVNHVSDIKLQQGDLAEAWREGEVDYATVAMRYTLNDTMVDRASNQVVENLPGEATEVWTFMRVRGGKWLVSAVQQA